ncbi:diacylglycerol kinase family protein [Desulforamulus aeronauticus]|uniref:Diacylglycerol kinase (ATP) n=1 Tax=Desulforamulus aeronauticus DSM 10349 TaxID=1121421 RepID=A0A1M6VE46_9FIRM|nr:diacylglycerol kinase family protein [Desulforamulus aeronauticus]SHK79729.1 diacylglycerol kinase (ATP) [Desulforamulus aeronauticus DSM 10349]
MMKGLLKSFTFALAGIWYVVRTQKNMKVHFTAALLAVVVSLFLCLSPLEWGLVFSAIFMVLLTECINTAIEAVVDLISPKFHPLAKIAKDCAAGAVLLAAVYSLAVAGLVLLPKVWGRM